MTKSEYDSIMQSIYENGRVQDDGDDTSSQTIEFDHEASNRGFTDAEIADAHRKFD